MIGSKRSHLFHISPVLYVLISVHHTHKATCSTGDIIAINMLADGRILFSQKPNITV